MRFKQQTQLNQKCSGAKRSKLRGIPKLDDANDAGTKNSIDCTLILTEGDSAKTLAVAGLGVVGRDRYGVFPLRGKVLNVREAAHKQVSNQHSFKFFCIIIIDLISTLLQMSKGDTIYRFYTKYSLLAQHAG